MTKSGVLIAVGIVVLLVGAGLLAFTQFSLDAVRAPGPFETRAATWAKHRLVRRASRSGIPPAPADRESSLVEGDKLFGLECATCHGLDGHKSTDAGRWMYPRAADLTSKEVQSYSDRELFWIIKNGIRLSGMPAFAKVESDEHIWDLVLYLRTLPGTTNKTENRNRTGGYG
jgi:mono/diheme cytochrome c family protein